MLAVLTDETKLNKPTARELAQLKKRRAISARAYLRKRHTSAATPTFYGLPKLHKSGVTLSLKPINTNLIRQ